ncbi:preprotein translocase subunit SecY [Candidatus Pacearchaeota archaeon]|nr:preprotein translocase subunit SecY [Candidatus Pacearchaeota archaeon]
MALKDILKNLPEVKPPVEKKLSFNVKLKWTLIVLVAFFVLANIPLFGLAKNSLDRFQYLAVILGTDFGSIISLGIGPIVMASIILQLLVGSKIIQIDTTTPEGKKYFQGLQKLMVFFFIIFEAAIYVVMRGLEALPGYTGIMIFQLVLGGVVIVFMDELVQKWGFGSGVSLFIVAGVGWRLFTGLFQFIGPEGGNCLLNFAQVACGGKVLVLIQSVIQGAPTEALRALVVIVATALIFLVVVWAQSLKVEIPLVYDKLRGYGIKWPLSFFYANVLPVILVSALAANVQLFAGLLENWLGHPTFLGTFSQGVPVSGFSFWIYQVNLLDLFATGRIVWVNLVQAFGHILFYVIFSAIFAMFWIKTSGMDASSQAKNILSSGLQIPGFRKDERVLESILKRYIMPLTIMGGAAVGLLAAGADLLGAIGSGTGILLAVMIIYQLYNSIAQQHAVDMHPALKKLSS